MRYPHSILAASVCLITTATALIPNIAAAQTAEKLSSKYIPDDAIVAGFLSPVEIMSSPEWALMPTEVIRAAGLEYVGIDPMDIQDVKIVFGMPGPAGPLAGAIIRFSKDVSIGDLHQTILQEFDPKEFEGIEVYENRDRSAVRLHQLDPRTIVVSSGGYLKRILEAPEGGSGQLPEIAEKISRRSGVTLIAVLDQIRPMITGMLQSTASRLPPQLRGLVDVGELTDAMLVNVKYGPMTGSLAVSLIGRDEASAVKLEQTLNNAIDFGRMMATTEMMKNLQGSGAVNEAMGQYVNRVGGQLSDMIRPNRQGKLVRVNLESGVGSAGILVGLLLPAVQAAREAARRMTASNELKQIGLAMHNYHSAFRKFPDRAIRDNEGKPLLSWRVAILPFIEQQDLYKKFRLDEPWDSPHNIQLLDQMPTTYVDPSVIVPPGHTVFQLAQGEGLLFEETGERKFREILDGTSNTIMAVESSREAAVPWTKPADLEFDLSDPLAKTGDAHQGGFHVLMADGAVVFISNSIDQDVFRAMLTRNGRETIDRQKIR